MIYHVIYLKAFEYAAVWSPGETPFMAVIHASMRGTVVADKWYVRPVFVTIENLAPSSPCGCTAITISMMLITPATHIERDRRDGGHGDG